MEAIRRAIYHAVRAAELRGMALERFACRHSEAAAEYLEMAEGAALGTAPSPNPLDGG